MDTNNFNLAKYISIGVNNPKKYPQRPFLAQQLEIEDGMSKPMTVKEMQEVAKRLTYKLGGKVK